MKSIRILALGMTLAAVLAGCGGGGGGSSSSNKAVFAVTNTNDLVKFDLDDPTEIDLNVPITGLQGGETIVGIDFRGATSTLYAVGSTSRLYSINTVTGAATQVGGITFATPLSGNNFGVDFNDVPDRIRITSDTEQSMRINPNDASVSGVDTALNPAGNIVDVAYLPPSSGLTTLYGIDSAVDTLVRIGGVDGSPSPNGGVVSTVGVLGTAVANASSFDIDTDNDAWMSSNVAAGTTNLYSVNLSTGAATFIGVVGDNLNVVSIAIQP